MRRILLALALLPAALPRIAWAEPIAPANWHVTGAVSGHAFVLDCRFTPSPKGFTGACTEAPGGEGQPGKVHPLATGTIAGDHVTWTYPVTAFLMHFAMTFDGTLAGNRLTGTAGAAGHSGSFTAVRQP
jgi:hypothetical protein